uniref:Carboxylic ester hydrolase n=1 Tax=Panagrolaimus sp. ES5 TaxID=591445 RepID=A0AC34GQ10_9BILA
MDLKGVFSGTLTTPLISDESIPVFAQTEYGAIEGFIHKADDGTVANIFLGIPYAKPPIEELRFERPVVPEPWNKILETKQFRNSCIPYSYTYVKKKHQFSEDCLYINVIAPSKASENPDGYPILIFIHGGGFYMGDVTGSGYDKITKNFASRGLITVTVPYRLGIYGFMSLGTKEDPGNIGLWDQIAALKFIKSNAIYFGGNPNNLIVWGQSAGSASVDLLTLSPHSRNLFDKAIEGSAVASCRFAESQPSTELTKEIAFLMGCNSTNPSDIKAFLKAQTWQNILDVSSTICVKDPLLPNFYAFGPRYDHDFFDGKTIEQLIQEAPKKSLIVGLMSLEGAGFTGTQTCKFCKPNNVTILGLLGKSASELAKYSAENVTDAICQYANEATVGPEYQEIQDDIINYFIFHNAPTNPNSSFYIQKNAELFSDLMFSQQILYETDLKVEAGWPIYFYVWNYMSATVQNTLPAAKGAWHSAELMYVFDKVTQPQNVLGPEEIKIQKYYCDAFAQFAYSGSPTTFENKFPKYDLINRRSLWIEPTLSIKLNFMEERRNFWRQHTEKFNFNILRGRTRSQIINGDPLDG